VSSNQDERGRFVPGNIAALVHGARRDVRGPELAPLISEKRAQFIESLGGELELMPIALEVVESLARASVLGSRVFAQLVSEGPLTAKGRKRAIFTVWADLDEKVNRRATQLGLQRRTKTVTPAEFFNREGANDDAGRRGRTAAGVVYGAGASHD
jgi:hypothetical protein